MSADVATSKGTILRSLLKFVEQDLGPERFEKALSMLSPDDQKIVREKVLPSQLVPEATLNRLTEAAAKVMNEDLEKFGIRAGRAELADAIGIYRFLLVVLTPAGLLAKAPAFWGSVHNKGKLAILERGDTSARIALEDFPSERAHCARLTGWFLGLAEKTKVAGLRIEHDVCRTRGAARCEWIATWSA